MAATQYYVSLNEEDLHHLSSGNDKGLKEVVILWSMQHLTKKGNAKGYGKNI